MANPPSNKVPPRKAGGNRPGGRPAPPRKPPPKRRSGRSAGRFYLYFVIALVVIVIAVIIALVSGGGSKSHSGGAALDWKTPSGVPVYGALGPEGIPIELGTQLGEPNTGLTGATIDGVPCNNTEQLEYHHHAHLMMFVNGKPMHLPIGVGFVPPASVEGTQGKPTTLFAVAAGTNCLYWLHVHAQDGIIHIESPTPKEYQLGQFFAIWHQQLSATQLGPFTGTVTATVNGQTWTSDPSQIPLGEHTQVVLNLGGPIIAPPAVSFSGTQL